MNEAILLTIQVPSCPLPETTATVLCDALAEVESLLQQAEASEFCGCSVDWQTVDRQNFDQQSVDRQNVNQQTVDRQFVNRQTVDRQNVDRQKAYRKNSDDVKYGANDDIYNVGRSGVSDCISDCPVVQSLPDSGILESREENKRIISQVPTYHWLRSPSVLALIPHWRCEPWLHRCLASLVRQTQPLTHIVVIDDGSEPPPVEIVKAFAGVTLLSARNRVGPYCLIQSVIEMTNYTAYLFQDADDWSSRDRLETLLKTAHSAGAELAGSQEIRLLESSRTLQTVGYPVDVNKALAQAPGHGLLHPTSLVTRELVQRLGGFATGLKFGADSEFLLRAQWAARIVNSPRYCYFRRKRAGSLTTAAETGLESPARQQLTQAIKQRAILRNQAAALQQPLDLSPLQVAPSVELKHICGPQLQWT